MSLLEFQVLSSYLLTVVLSFPALQLQLEQLSPSYSRFFVSIIIITIIIIIIIIIMRLMAVFKDIIDSKL